jgi:hypothetical protein
MRLVVFVLAGALLGVIGARWGTKTKAVEVATEAPPSGASTSRVFPGARRSERSQPRHQEDLAPGDPRYDPLAILRADDTIHAKDIFEREPRDPVFAPVLEKRVPAALDEIFKQLKLEDKVHTVHTECKTLSCYTYIEVDDSDVEQVYDEINGIVLGDGHSPGLMHASADKPARVTIYNLYRPESRDDARYQKLLNEGMRPALDLAKQRYLKDPDKDEAPH